MSSFFKSTFSPAFWFRSFFDQFSIKSITFSRLKLIPRLQFLTGTGIGAKVWSILSILQPPINPLFSTKSGRKSGRNTVTRIHFLKKRSKRETVKSGLKVVETVTRLQFSTVFQTLLQKRTKKWSKKRLHVYSKKGR